MKGRLVTFMDTHLITVLAAAVGSIIGAAASVSTTWITQHKQTVRELIQSRLREREALYREFISEASRLTLDAASHSLETVEGLVKLYSIVGRIRLASSDAVLTEAENCCRKIVDLYSEPNKTIEQIIASFERDELDPLKPFSTVCRAELGKFSWGL
jgi:hypothetical protein